MSDAAVELRSLPIVGTSLFALSMWFSSSSSLTTLLPLACDDRNLPRTFRNRPLPKRFSDDWLLRCTDGEVSEVDATGAAAASLVAITLLINYYFVNCYVTGEEVKLLTKKKFFFFFFFFKSFLRTLVEYLANPTSGCYCISFRSCRGSRGKHGLVVPSTGLASLTLSLSRTTNWMHLTRLLPCTASRDCWMTAIIAQAQFTAHKMKIPIYMPTFFFSAVNEIKHFLRLAQSRLSMYKSAQLTGPRNSSNTESTILFNKSSVERNYWWSSAFQVSRGSIYYSTTFIYVPLTLFLAFFSQIN